MKRAYFDKKLVKIFLEFLDARNLLNQYDHQKRQLNFFDQDSKPLIKVRLPLDLAYDEKNKSLKPIEFKHYVLVLIRAGIAAVGYFENFTNVDHKVFRAYMVRKKQGKSQIKYLKTKGKSRAGSRVRLAETLEFFQEINQRLNTYFDQFPVDEIGISYSETLMPYFYGSKINPPFQKGDPRLFKIPKHVQNPTYKTLLETNEYLLKAEIKFNEAGKFIWEEFFNNLNMNESEIEKDDDW